MVRVTPHEVVEDIGAGNAAEAKVASSLEGHTKRREIGTKVLLLGSILLPLRNCGR